MNKKIRIALIAIGSLLFLGLLIFISTHKFDDSHLRIEGIRVRLQDQYALLIDGCDEETKNIAYCEKTVKVKDKEEKVVFQFKDFMKDGYPSALIGTINGKEFYKREGLDLKNNPQANYTIVLNIEVIEDVIVFTITEGASGRGTTLYAIDVNGNVILKEFTLDEEDMLIKDYIDFIKIENNKIKVYASRLDTTGNYKGKSVCEAKSKDVVEAYYTYTYKDGKFTKKQTDTITAKEYIKENEVTCENEK
ncbi:MAG: hypothetical protein E7163_05240 [Firmicutes bacterium]|nr:hypothetical protein [Bacillota bacterium]